MKNIFKDFFNWKVEVKLDPDSGMYLVTNRSKLLFMGNKKDCLKFLDVHTVSSLVSKEALFDEK